MGKNRRFAKQPGEDVRNSLGGFSTVYQIQRNNIEQRMLAMLGSGKIGGGWMVYIVPVEVNRIAPYLCKYMTKEMIIGRNDQKYRRYTTSQNIHLFEKPKMGQWQLIKTNIELLFVQYFQVILIKHHDDVGLLTSFVFGKANV
jgi:hypothetical protein